jgi:hypothetical protein
MLLYIISPARELASKLVSSSRTNLKIGSKITSYFDIKVSSYQANLFWKVIIIKMLHNEELHNLYSSPSIIRIVKSRRMRWAGHVARMGEKRNVYRLLVGKPEGKRQLGRPRRRWTDNIKMDLLEIGVSVVD